MDRKILYLANLSLLVGLAPAHADIKVAGVRRAEEFAFSTGVFMSDARLALNDASNFGPLGIVKESVSILPDIAVLTPASLSGVDVLIASILGRYEVAEASAVRDFVVGGGSLLFYGDVGQGFGVEGNTMSGPFGITYSTDDFEGGPPSGPSVSIVAPAHPIISGPFGTSRFSLDATGSIVGQTHAMTVATIDSGPTSGRAFMVVQDSSTGFPGSGAAIWLSDVNILANNFGLYRANEILFLNTFAYAATIVPEPKSLWILGMGGFGLMVRREK